MIIHHGSENSLDIDVYVVISTPIENIQECKELCETYPNFNTNLICIDNGQVSWCYKGTIDECNNSILSTYHLHKENLTPCPVTVKLERNVDEKIKRTLRGLLTYMSRTELRTEVKEALRSEDINLKISVLKKIQFYNIPDFGKKGINTNVYKFIAFQLIQTTALILKAEEIFTKTAAGEYSPSLKKYLQREISEHTKTSALQFYYIFFLKLVENYYKRNEDES